MSQIAFHFFCHTGKTVIAFKKQWYNAVTPRDPRTTPLRIENDLGYPTSDMVFGKVKVRVKAIRRGFKLYECLLVQSLLL